MEWFDPNKIKNDENLDIRFNLEMGLIKKNSLILNFLTKAVYWLQFISPVIWYAYWRKSTKEKTHWFPTWVTEGWIIFKFLTLLLLLLILGLWVDLNKSSWLILQIFPIWYLLDNLTALGRDIILAPNLHSGKIYVYDFQRWVILTLIGALEVIFCFAVIVLANSSSFENLDRHPILNSIYYSAITFCTVGYGDIHPVKSEIVGQIISMSELFYFFIFLVIKIPLAISMYSVKIINRPDLNNEG